MFQFLNDLRLAILLFIETTTHRHLCLVLVAQIDQGWHIGDSCVEMFSIISLLRAANFEFIHDWRYMINRSTSNLKNIHEHSAKHSFRCVLTCISSTNNVRCDIRKAHI